MKKLCCNLKRVTFLFLLMLIVSMNFVSAITASIGNSKMILRVTQGDVIEKYILVKNVNDVPVEIEMTPEGDLVNYIKIEEEKFTLDPGAEKKAVFTINVKNSGRTESKIYVKFNPIDNLEKNGVGLSSTIIVIADKKPGFIDSFFNDEELDQADGLSNDTISKVQQKIISSKLMIVSAMMTTVIFIVLLILMIYSYKIRSKIKSKNKLKKSKKQWINQLFLFLFFYS